MSANGKEYKLAIKIAGNIDRSFNASLAAANSSLKKTVSAVNGDFNRLDKGFNAIVGVGKRCFSAMATAAGVAAVAIGAAISDCTKEASTFEHQMADVMKYVNGLADAAGRASNAMALDADGNILNGKTYAENYKEMKSALLDLSKQIPMTAEELTRLSAAAGQSGYGITDLFGYDSSGNITGFLKDTAVMATAMDITAEQAGDWAAKWEKAFNMTHDEIMVLADQINYLGANSATTAAEIAQVVNDAASLGQIAGMDVSTTAALADAMLATGVSSDKVATSVKRTITNLSRGTSATKAMQEQWAELGFTAEGVAIAMQEDSIETLKSVFTAIGDLPDYKQVAALSTLFGQWAIEGDAKIVGNMKVFQDALDMVNDPGKYNGSMEREFTIKASTSENIDTMVDNAVKAMKINIGDSFLPIKKEYSQKLIDFIDGITEKMTAFNSYLSSADGLSKWMRNIETQFPTFQRKFKKFVQPVFSGIMEGGKWIIKHGREIVSVLTGIGAALAAYKAASSIAHIVQAILSLGSLNPITMGIMVAVGAIGLFVGALTAIKQHEQGLIDQSLADHFGDIALSMEELRRVAEYIVSSESLGGVQNALDAFKDLDSLSATLQDAVAEIDKLNWKISIGMELTEEENESYKQAIDSYIRSAQDYALQSQYAVSLNMQIAFSESDFEGQNVVDKVNQFYADQYDELSALGTQLNEALTEAFNDGLLDIKETKVIADIQRQMAEIEEALATGEFDAQLSVIGMEYAGGGSLSAESFQNLQEELASQVEEASQAYQESYVKNYAAIQAAYEAGDYLSEDEYQNALENLQGQYLENIGALQAKAINFQLETIMNQYAGELDPAIESYMNQAQEIMESYMENGEADWMDRPALLWMGMVDAFSDSDLDKTTKKAISQLLDAMQPSISDIRELEQQYADMGKEIPESLHKGLSDFALLDVLANSNLESANVVLSEQLPKSEYYESFYKDILTMLDDSYGLENLNFLDRVATETGTATAASTASQIAAATDTVIRPVVSGTYETTQDMIDEYYSKGFKANADLAVTLNTKYGNNAWKNASSLAAGIDHNATGGIIREKELSWLAENGPEAVVPLDGSKRAVALWEKAGQLLGMDSILDRYDIEGGSQSLFQIEYNPTMQFYGEAPSKTDLVDALSISQDEFDRHMEQWMKKRGRVSFG